ncbi:hypothetical protein KDW_44340 [Dictyobacter vulcani]|uniref:Carrier domain-containing protein n=1 Tax=Dictyobacter vulcani TaxID=2607529 RepID=A0A5J4KSZ5_9CHLR|nr:acyl carrier protein [Dictyobacter vulcani]GER90272.1 hypothetical protein KDW_44340 [Dictyobacter vulcani]
MVNDALQETIYPRVVAILRCQVDEDDEIRSDTDLLTDLGIDSIGQVEICLALEKEFGLRFSIAELRVCTTVDEVVQLVVHTIAGKEAASK